MTMPADKRHTVPGGSALGAAGVLGFLLVAGSWLPAPALAHMRGMFATKAEAEQRAAELKCKGVFAMGSLWMPCANERALHDALQKAQ